MYVNMSITLKDNGVLWESVEIPCEPAHEA